MPEHYSNIGAVGVTSANSPFRQLDEDSSYNEELVRARDEIEMLETSNEDLKVENASLRADLNDCRAVVFTLQGQHEVSDSSIMDEYTRIYQAIDTWVDNAMDHVPDGRFNSIYREQMLNDKKRARVIKDLGDVSSYRLTSYERSDYLVLSTLIQRHLDGQIFYRQYPVGLPKLQQDVVTDIKETMLRGSLAKEELSVEKWRAETVQAMTTLPDFRSSRAFISKKILQSVKKTLHHWLRSTDLLDRKSYEKQMDRFERDIHIPAIKLLQTMRTSIRQYEFQKQTPSQRITIDQMFDQYTLKDVNTWASVKKTRNHEQMPQFLCCLHPALIRLGVEGREDMKLVKPVMVVLSKQVHHGATITHVANDAESAGENLTAKGLAFEEADSDSSSFNETDDQEQPNVDECGRSATWPGKYHQHSDGSLSNQPRTQGPTVSNERQLSNGVKYTESTGRATFKEAVGNSILMTQLTRPIARLWDSSKKM